MIYQRTQTAKRGGDYGEMHQQEHRIQEDNVGAPDGARTGVISAGNKCMLMILASTKHVIFHL